MSQLLNHLVINFELIGRIAAGLFFIVLMRNPILGAMSYYEEIREKYKVVHPVKIAAWTICGLGLFCVTVLWFVMSIYSFACAYDLWAGVGK